MCDDDFFLVVIDEMMTYEELAPYLGITRVQIHELKNDYPHEYKLAKMNFLQLWRDKNGPGATMRALVCAFLNVGDREAAEAIVGHVKQISVSCQRSDPDSVHPEKAPHRYPNWSDMSKEEKKATKESLIVENAAVKRKYATCVTRISRSFQRRNADLNELKTNLEAFKISPELASATSVSAVFFIISQNSSFFNYSLLDGIITDLGHEEEQKLLSEYKNDVLKPYLQRSIFEVPSDSIGTYTVASRSSSYFPCLKFVERIDLSAEEVIVIKHDLAVLLELPSLELAHYDAGSIHLIFTISKVVYDDCPATSLLRQYVVWDKDSSSYVVTDDIVLIL